MCDIKQCLLQIMYPKSDNSTYACDTDCFFKGDKKKVCELQDEEYDESKYVIDVESIKRKQ